ncbi:MobF family relaxase [Streptomyces sp. NPDC020141]|uniref:MobF family relaxase n=1 Tax=Streptomyces sp. NPDC020141 TaxID=3365065 RepID=UPI00379011E6
MRGVAIGDGRRPAGQPLKGAQERAGPPPGVWMGRGLAGLGLAAGSVVGERELELVFGELRHPDADRIERELLAGGATPAAARLATVLGQPVEEIEKRDLVPLLGLEFVFRPQASLVVLWALGDAHTRRVIERAVATVLEWLEDEVAEVRWSSGRRRARPPGLVAASFRHWDNRDGFPLLHHHLLILNRAQRADGVWYAIDTCPLYQHAVASGTLYTLAMTTELCEELGLATVPREVTPGLRPVMEIAGVPAELIEWKSTRRERIEDALETITDGYVKKHGRLPDERARHNVGWWAAQDTRPDKKTPHPLEQLLVWWRASAILNLGQQMIAGLLERCRTAAAVIRAGVRPLVDTALAALDVYTVRNAFARRHVLAEARRHLLETLRGRAYPPGVDDYIANQALARHTAGSPCPRKGAAPRHRTRSPTPPTSRGLPAGSSPGPAVGRPVRRPATSGGPRSPASPCRTRSAPPAPRPLRRGTEPRPRPRRPRTPATLTTTTKTGGRPIRRTPSTTPAGTLPSPPPGGPPPSRPTRMRRCPRCTSRAGRLIPRRGRPPRSASPPSPN